MLVASWGLWARCDRMCLNSATEVASEALFKCSFYYYTTTDNLKKAYAIEVTYVWAVTY